jgi:GAF domain-containing protein
MAAREQLPPRLGSALDELRATLARAAELAKQLEAGPEGGADPDSRLADVEADRDELSTKLAEYEHQVQRLMNLYVATYQLHATLDPGEVQATIAEIAINLLGAERFVLLFWKTDNAGDGRSGDCEIALAQGMEDDKSGSWQNGVYSGGDPAVDATLADGVLRIGPIGGSDALACVPLAVQGATVGALVILKLFDHKEALRAEDRDLLDLIAAHAASALFAARVYSNTDRKLKTLESLVALVRRQ